MYKQYNQPTFNQANIKKKKYISFLSKCNIKQEASDSFDLPGNQSQQHFRNILIVQETRHSSLKALTRQLLCN